MAAAEWPLHFGRFTLIPAERQLLCDGQPVALRARALDVLIVLAQSAGSLVSRDQLFDRVWRSRVVEENNLSVQVNALRQVLGAELIATVPGRGYRLVAKVRTEGAAATAPPVLADAGPALRTNLPDVLPPLLGRDIELQQAAALVDAHALVTVLGAAGIGKTRLVQAVLHQRRAGYGHGVCLVELAAAPPDADLALWVASALGLPQPGGADPLASVVRLLAPLELLIALDNAEHLAEAVAAFANAVLGTAPRVRLIVTSQVPLYLAAEHRLHLHGLALPPAGADAVVAAHYGAVALFVARAQATWRGFRLDEATLPAVIEVCQGMGGSPLAIELAAARLPLLGLAGLASSLQQPLQLLVLGQTGVSARHQTLRAALQWSHQLLSPVEQTVFRRLAVFVGSTSLELVQDVLAEAGGPDAGWALLNALGTLVDRSLVSIVEQGAEEPPRYRLLELPRALADELLRASGEWPGLRQRHAHAMRAQLDRAVKELLEGQVGLERLIDRLEPDIHNAQAALRWALAHDTTLALAIAPGLSLALGHARHRERSQLWAAVEPLFDTVTAASPGLSARARLACAEHWSDTHAARALAHAEVARTLALAAADAVTALRCLPLLAGAAAPLERHETVRLAVAAASGAATAQQPPYLRMMLAFVQAIGRQLEGDVDGEVQGWRTFGELRRAAGASDTGAIGNAARALLSAGRIAEARPLAATMVARLSASRDQRRYCQALAVQASVLLSDNDAAAARPAVTAYGPLAEQFDMLAEWADDAGQIAALEDRPRAALRLFGLAEAGFAQLGRPRDEVDARRVARAEARARQALAVVAPGLRPDLLKADGALLLGQGLPAWALDTADA